MLFHDAVYDPLARDNEEKSAELAREMMAKYVLGADLDPDRVVELVLLTSGRGSVAASAVDLDAALFLDCDMAILGANPEVFDAYDAAVALEYAGMATEVYALGRSAFLRRLLDSDRIFLSDYGRRRWEAVARGNLARALARGATAT